MTENTLESRIDEIFNTLTEPGFDLSAEMKKMADEQPAYLAFISQDEVDLLVDEEHLHYYLLMTLVWLLRTATETLQPDQIVEVEEANWALSKEKYWLDDVDVPAPLLDALEDILHDIDLVPDVLRLMEVHYVTACNLLIAP